MMKFLLRATTPLALTLGLLAPARAADEAGTANLQQQLEELRSQIADLKRSTGAQYVDIQGARAGDTRVSLGNGRPTFTSADGKFTASLRGLIQYDLGYYSEGKEPAGIDLSSGGNFRRAQIGIQGAAFGDWSYNFVYDFAGSSTEKAGYIYTAYAEYDGLRPFGFRIGAYAPPAGLEDSTSSGDLIFPERPASVDVARNIAGSPSRDSATVFYAGGRVYGALSYTGDKVSNTATYDEQQALVGRVAVLAYQDADSHILLDGDFTHVFKLPDASPGAALPLPTTSFSITPEVSVDDVGTKFINTGNITASTVTEWGFETAANYKNIYAQGGYFNYSIGRTASALSDPNFSGWYVAATYVLTGESRRYNATTATFQNPSSTGPWGTWEVAARYSNLDLNNNAGIAGAAAPSNGVRGGNQNVVDLELNWYPNSVFHFGLDFDDVRVSRLSAAGGDAGAHVQAVVLRSQVSF